MSRRNTEMGMRNEIEVAIAAARDAGQLIRAGFGNPHPTRSKGNAINLVTQIDQQAEALILSRLQQAFPSYGFLAEESPAAVGSGEKYWLIDPLDGTTNYAHGYPVVAVSIALVCRGDVVLGVVYNPIADELFVAEKGAGATLNGHPIHVSSTATLAESLLASGFPYDAWEGDDDNTTEWRSFLKRVVSLRSDGSAAWDLCSVACGRLDGYWELDLDPWDMAAGSLIVQEAGGQVTDLSGSPFNPFGRSILASNGHIHPEMLEVLRQARRGRSR